jgi:arylsulfatase A-like enzyme
VILEFKGNIKMKKPNILIVMTDHQRADTVLPDNPCIMPNVKKMATQGVNFTKTYPPMSHCCPARATFMSSLYPSRSGVWNNVNNDYAINRGPHRGIKMWSQDLQEAGYDLSYCGKWHVSALDDQTPKDYGWKELDRKKGSIQDAGVKWEKIRENANNPIPDDGDGWVNPPGYNPHRLYGEQEVAFKGDDKATDLALDEMPKLAESGKPWVLFVGWAAPHTPYNAEKKYLDMYDLEETELPPSFEDTMEDKPDYYRKLRQRVFDRNDIKGVKEAIRHFRACCSKIDFNFGRLLEKLDEVGQTEDTLVLFCADHGDYVGDHGLFHKQVPAFLGAYMVPAVVKWPKGIKNPGRTVDDFVSLADFGPTFLDMAGIKTDRYFSGDTLVPFLKDEKPLAWREEMCTQCEGTEQMFTQRMVSTHEYKYVYNGFGRDELYDLVNDPHEMKNLEDDPKYDDIKRDLVKRMWRFAYKEQDQLGSTQYIMVNTAPWGPA